MILCLIFFFVLCYGFFALFVFVLCERFCQCPWIVHSFVAPSGFIYVYWQSHRIYCELVIVIFIQNEHLSPISSQEEVTFLRDNISILIGTFPFCSQDPHSSYKYDLHWILFNVWNSSRDVIMNKKNIRHDKSAVR